MTAALEDQSEYMKGRMPLFITGVIGLSFLLLLVAFHSPLISLKAAIMNLLSVSAAYGVMTMVAKGGPIGKAIGIDHEVPIAPFMPVMMFAILFGLSMDYEVFLISRIREEYLKDGNTSRAIADGLARTARVITAAAAIMVVVFLAFLAAPDTFLKLFGIGLASAIFLDATLVRMVLVPAVMQLLGPLQLVDPGLAGAEAAAPRRRAEGAWRGGQFVVRKTHARPRGLIEARSDERAPASRLADRRADRARAGSHRRRSRDAAVRLGQRRRRRDVRLLARGAARAAELLRHAASGGGRAARTGSRRAARPASRSRAIATRRA